jgi:transposase
MFKSYTTNDNLLLPPTFGDLIEEKDPVRVINRIIESVDLKALLEQYPGGGCPAYHPRMILKLLVYAYMRNIYSSRRIEEFARHDIRFMWLIGTNCPDHNTINRFRGGQLKDALRNIFAQVVQFMVEEKLVSLDTVYTDGTKIESAANRYTFVWGKAMQTSIGRIADQINELWAYAESVTKQELMDTAPVTYQDVTPEKVVELVERIEQALDGAGADKKVIQKLRYAKKSWPQTLQRYDEQEKILDGRNSYSKTDRDATFMRMKEDHMLNGQLKPAYNVQISTNKQFITNYTIHQSATDTGTYKQHIETFKDMYGKYPDTAVADAGYGSEENYVYAQEKGMKTFIKYNFFHKEQAKNWKNDPFRSSNFHYNPDRNCFYCPMGQAMRHIGDRKQMTANGFEQTISRYQAQNCEGCPLRGSCHKAEGNRIIEVNHNLNKLRNREREKLMSEDGLLHRSQRPQDVEATFGNLKSNKGFKRFRLRGLRKTETEFGLLALAHNLAKIA